MKQKSKPKKIPKTHVAERSWIRSNLLLVTILLFAFALRISSITWGLQFGFSGWSFHPDEGKLILPALNFWEYYGTTKPYYLYGTSFQYTVGVLFLLTQGAMELVGMDLARNLAFGWLFCRFMVVLSGTFGVLLVYMLGARLFSKETGILGASLLAVSPFHTLHSAWFKLDVPMSVLLIGAILLTIRLKERQGLGDYALLGGAFGYLLGTKILSGFFLIIPFAAILLGWWPVKDWKHMGKGLLLGAGTGAFIFCVLNPQYLLGFQDILNKILFEKRDWFDRMAPDTIVETMTMFWSAYSTSLSLPITILAIIGMLTFDRKEWGLKVALCIFLLVYTLSFYQFYSPRYVIFVVPILCLFAANCSIWLMKNRHTVFRVLGVTVTSLAIINTAVVATIGATARHSDPRIDAAQYIAKTYPGKATVGFSFVSEKYMWMHRWRYPRIVNMRHRVMNMLERPDIIVTSSYDLDQIEPALHSPHLQNNYVWNPMENRKWYRYSPPSPRLFAFYEALFRESGSYKLTKVFPRPASAGVEWAPPEIRIYEHVRMRK